MVLLRDHQVHFVLLMYMLTLILCTTAQGFMGYRTLCALYKPTASFFQQQCHNPPSPGVLHVSQGPFCGQVAVHALQRSASNSHCDHTGKVVRLPYYCEATRDQQIFSRWDCSALWAGNLGFNQTHGTAYCHCQRVCTRMHKGHDLTVLI